MNSPDLSQPTRQSIKGLVVILINSIVNFIRRGFFAILALLVTNRKIMESEYFIYGIIGIFIIILIHSILYYLNFYFYIENEEFVLKKGYLQKKVLSIPLERIQSVNTKQNVLQQILRVTAVEIDTAGTAAKELKIHALEMNYSDALANEISRKKKINVETSEEESEVIVEKADDIILRLDNTELLKVGISRNHLRAALLLLVFGNQIYNEVKDIFTSQTEEYSRQATEYFDNAGWMIIGILIVVFLLIAISYSMIETLLKYYKLRFAKNEDNFKMISGLLNRQQILIPFKKIQIVSWQTSPLMKLFNIYQVRLLQASSAEVKTKNIINIPGCYDNHVEDIKGEVFENKPEEINEIVKPHFYLFRRHWIRAGWLLALIPAPFFYDQLLYWGAAFVWLIITGILSYVSYKKRYAQIDNQYIITGKGMFGREWNMLEQFKIQAVRVNQNYFQKRRNLSTLTIYTAGGDLKIPYIDEDKAKFLHDYLLYKIESSQKDWM
jgi:putative membrane protein